MPTPFCGYVYGGFTLHDPLPQLTAYAVRAADFFKSNEISEAANRNASRDLLTGQANTTQTIWIKAMKYIRQRIGTLLEIYSPVKQTLR